MISHGGLYGGTLASATVSLHWISTLNGDCSGLDYDYVGHLATKLKGIGMDTSTCRNGRCCFLLAFVIINLLLGCETWDESLWTEYNSC